MKILHVFDHSLPVHSGYSLRSAAILREQRKLGWQTLHLTSSKHGLAMQDLEQVGDLEFYRTSDAHSWARKIPVVNQWDVVRLLRARLAGLIRQTRPDLLQVHSPCLNGLAALGLGVPVVYELRTSWEDGAVMNGSTTEGSVRYRLSRALESHVLRRADAITTICEGLRAEVLGRGIAPSTVTVVPNAVDAEVFAGIADAPARRDVATELGLRGCYVLGYLGTYFSWEGLSLLIEAMPSILQEAPNVRVLLVGQGLEEENLRRRVAALNLQSQVLFKSPVPHAEVGDFYRAIDCLVYPRPPVRLTEIVTPLKPLEAMAMGKVVIASDVGGHRELVRDGVTGRLFKAGDPGALARAVLEIMRNSELQGRFREQGRRFVRAERTWASSVAAYEPVYRQLLGRAG